MSGLSASGPADTPDPPYVAVIFSNTRRDDDPDYDRVADAMERSARRQPGFLGFESARGADGFGISVSYWRTEADAQAWRADADHLEAQRRGRQDWYGSYTSRVAVVGRAARFEAGD